MPTSSRHESPQTVFRELSVPLKKQRWHMSPTLSSNMSPSMWLTCSIKGDSSFHEGMMVVFCFFFHSCPSFLNQDSCLKLKENWSIVSVTNTAMWLSAGYDWLSTINLFLFNHTEAPYRYKICLLYKVSVRPVNFYFLARSYIICLDDV